MYFSGTEFYWRSKKIAVPRSYLMDICSQMTASEFEYPAATRGYLWIPQLEWHTFEVAHLDRAAALAFCAGEDLPKFFW